MQRRTLDHPLVRRDERVVVEGTLLDVGHIYSLRYRPIHTLENDRGRLVERMALLFGANHAENGGEFGQV